MTLVPWTAYILNLDYQNPAEMREKQGQSVSREKEFTGNCRLYFIFRKYHCCLRLNCSAKYCSYKVIHLSLAKLFAFSFLESCTYHPGVPVFHDALKVSGQI